MEIWIFFINAHTKDFNPSNLRFFTLFNEKKKKRMGGHTCNHIKHQTDVRISHKDVPQLISVCLVEANMMSDLEWPS